MTKHQNNNYWLKRAAESGVFQPETHFGRENLPCFRNRFENLQVMFAYAVEHAGTAEALVFNDQRLNYQQLDSAVTSLAGGLYQLGLKPGSRLGILMGNRIEFVVGLLACIRLCAIAVPINVRLQTPEIQYIVDQSGMDILLIDEKGHSNYPKTTIETGLQHIVATDNVKSCDTRDTEHLLSLSSINDNGHRKGLPPPSRSVKETDAALLMYTSGTTGKPKGAIVTHLGIINAAQIYAWSLRAGHEEKSIMSVPASHITGITANLFNMIGVSGCTVIMERFEAKEFVATAAREKITQTIIVPAMYNLCLMRTRLEDYDLSKWRIGGYGGAPMPESTILQLSERLPNLDLINVYGATETTGPVVMMPPGHTAGRGDSVGQILPSSRIDIVNEQGKKVADGEKGELRISGPGVVPGYWNNETANSENFIDEAWRSGDVGFIDEQGYLRLVDRLKDVINRGGYKIYSIEVENAIDFHPAIIESAVVAMPDSVLGEKIHAFVRSDSIEITTALVQAHCEELLADYKIPDVVTIIRDPLPRNANGKILKNSLREMQ